VPRWTPVFLVDAYINYQVNEHLLLTLSGTNLTDRYYLFRINQKEIIEFELTNNISLLVDRKLVYVFSIK
ncbi:TonB-dependent receptor, partial [Pasteurella multocida]|nr:TonB-dependent receptor [Pasteurella multocida]